MASEPKSALNQRGFGEEVLGSELLSEELLERSFWSKELLSFKLLFPKIDCIMKIFIWLPFLLEINARQDKCDHLAGKTIVSYDQAMDCYFSIPLTKKDQVSQINTLIKTLSFYAFLDISQNSPEPKIPSSNDLIDELLKLQVRNYTNGFQFHQDISSLFLSNHDGHLVYSSLCFEQFLFGQPFPLMAAENINGRQVIRVIPKLLIHPLFEEFWSNEGVDVQNYAGKEVLLINSWPVLHHLQYYGNNEIGISKDLNTRLSLTLAHPLYIDGKWGVSNGIHAVTDFLPNYNSVYYKIGNRTHSQNLKVPYLVTVSPEFKPGMNYYNEFCKLKSMNINNVKINQLLSMEVPKTIKMKIDSDLPRLTGSRADRVIDSPLFKSNYTHTYRIAKDVGVLAIPSFSSYNINGYFRDIQYALSSVKSFKKLILDFSNNGGGVICLGYHLLDTLISNRTKTRFSTDFRLSPLLIELIKKSENTNTFMDHNHWRKPDGSSFQNTAEFLNKRSFWRGNSYQDFSQPFIDNCPPNPLFSYRAYSKSDLAIVSNGLCFSTCALIVNALQEIYNVKSYVVGGDQSQPATVATLAGGTIFSLDTLNSHLKRTGLNHHRDAPPPLAINAHVSFTIREAYSNSTKNHHYQNNKTKDANPRPLEFTWLPANYHLPSTAENFYDPSLIWSQIATEMDKY